MNRFLILVTLGLATAAGCYTEADVGYGYAAPAPNMVAVEGAPGVQVIYDYDYPVFFYGGAYWRWDGGVWYSSRWYNRGWAVNYNAPVAFGRIGNPGVYAHYRGGYVNGGVGYRGGVAGGYRGPVRGPVGRSPAATPVTRSNTYRGPAPRPAARPVVRAHH
jgi:hypothetical protein